MLHIFKKKEKTPEQKIRISKITLAIVLCVGVAAIALSKFKIKATAEPEQSVENIMDTQIDTLLVKAGFQNYEIIKTCETESYIEEPSCAEEDSLAILNLKIEFAQATGKGKTIPDEFYERANILSQRIEDFKRNNKGVEMKARRIYFNSENNKYTCFQTLSPNGEQKIIYLTVLDNVERPEKTQQYK